MRKVVILGGTDGFGRWLANFVLENFEEDVELYITGRDKDKGEIVADDLGCSFSDNNIECVKDADIVVVSVPISVTVDLITQIGKYMKKGAILADVTSIKVEPAKAMNQFIEKGIISIPIHPLFGPFVNKVTGQVFALTPEESIKKTIEYKFLKKFLEGRGSVVVEISAKEHDELMSVIQGMTHFALFVLAETMRRLSVDIEFSQTFTSPVYKMMISLISRYMNQNMALYADIQMHNDQNIRVHETFIQVAKDLTGYVKDNDKDKFVETLTSTAKYFDKQASIGQKYTDKLIFLYSKQLEGLKNNVGKIVTIENIYTKEKIEGQLAYFDGDFIHINNDGEEKFHIGERVISN